MGIDPGKSGALAILDGDGLPVEVNRTPLVIKPGVKRDRGPYDVAAIRDYLERWRAAGKVVAGGLFVVLEKLDAMPPKYAPGGIANYNRGVATGWAWMLTALRIPFSHVLPRVWQAEMHEGVNGGDRKARSIEIARRLFPSVDLITPGKTTPSDGIAEALLMAEYGRRGGMRNRPSRGQMAMAAP